MYTEGPFEVLLLQFGLLRLIKPEHNIGTINYRLSQENV